MLTLKKSYGVFSAVRSAVRAAVHQHAHKTVLIAKPVKSIDYDALFKEVTAKYRKTLAYLAK